MINPFDPICCQSAFCGRCDCTGCEQVMPIIEAHLRATNNGKLMLERLPAHLRAQVPPLVADGKLMLDGFLRANDAIRIGPNA